MLWFPLTLFSAFMLATADALTKREVGATGFYMATWLRGVAALPLLALAMAFVPVPPLDKTFFVAVAVALPFEITASLLYIRAIQVSPLSLTVPFLALTPAYVVVISFLLLGEAPSVQGGAGVGLICLGAYLLNVSTVRGGGLFEPFRAITREPGSMMMMAVAAIYAITSNLGKLAILHSSPVFFAFFYWLLYCAALTPVLYYFDRGAFSAGRLKPALPVFLTIGTVQGAMVLTHMLAMKLTQVSYMVAVKRTSLLFGIGFGFLMFREKHIGGRLAGSLIMLAGLVLIVSQ